MCVAHGERILTLQKTIKVPEPKHFKGSRNAKELENFLWDMEQYFWAAKIPEREQTGSAREYVKEFSSLMLDIQNMSEEDKLFNFMSGLQKWAQAELRRQGVKDIPSAMAAAEGLVDFHLSGSTSSASDKGKSVEGKFEKNKDWKKKAADGRKEKEVKAKGKEPMQSKNSGCFICSDPHCNIPDCGDCPMKERVSALVSQEVET
ncbi:hypothetical protein ACOSP7_018912 [Xanthoceras sorbifolium]